MPLDLQSPHRHALVCAVTARSIELLLSAAERLGATLSPIRTQSATYPFEFTSYYEQEMGPKLMKELLVFTERIDPANLGAIKTDTMLIEREMAEDKGGTLRRCANLDPGLVSIESLVLATTKYSGHRICIGPRLYAETTLLFQGGRYRPLKWTYPDYREEELQDFFLEIRAQLMAGWD